MLMDRRDLVIQRLNAKKKFVISGEQPHESIRADGYNKGMDDAIQIVMEYL